MLLEPVDDPFAPCSASPPIAVLLPATKYLRASLPMAVLLSPVVLSCNDCEPTEVFEFPVVSVVADTLPIAVLSVPVTAASKAASPRTVLLETEFAPLPMVYY